MAASDAVGPVFGALVKFLTYTGARLGEALALRWTDVDLDRKLVTIRQTKTEGVRVAVLPDFVVDALTPLAREGRVFYPLTKGSVLYAMLTKAEKASGVTIPDRTRLPYPPAHLGDAHAPLCRAGHRGACRDWRLAIP